jgi:hypothetical protein
MRTTIDVSDALLDAARKRARERGTTLRAVFEEGLRAVLAADATPASFTLRDASVEGRGLQPAFRGVGWAEVRAAAYEERGG